MLNSLMPDGTEIKGTDPYVKATARIATMNKWAASFAALAALSQAAISLLR
jgi:hypothetical protein